MIWSLTRVWEVNGKMVVSKTIEDAVSLFRMYQPEVDIKSVKAIESTRIGRDYDALIKEGKE